MAEGGKTLGGGTAAIENINESSKAYRGGAKEALPPKKIFLRKIDFFL